MSEQLAFDIPRPEPKAEPEPRTYWENRGPNQWEPVTVSTRYAIPQQPPPDMFPHVTTGPAAPRNVLIERADGTQDVRPVRLLRRKQPR